MPLSEKELEALKAHIGRKATSYKAHDRHLQKDVNDRLSGSAHPKHAASRHGYQSGWQAQLIRVCTQYAPDQASTPDGVAPEIQEWNKETGTWASLRGFICSMSPIKLPFIDPPTVRVYGSDGRPTTASQLDQPIVPAADATVGGTEAGGFISPEAQQDALRRADSYAFKLWGWAEAKFASGGGVWRPFSRIALVIKGRTGGYGLGFSRVRGFIGNWRREAVVRAITAYEQRWDYERWEGELDVSMAALRNKLRFPQIEDLLDYLCIEAVWQRNAMIILDRNPHAYGKWNLVTAYPVNLALGWAPAGPQGGARHSASGPVWLGDVRKPGNAPGTWVQGNYPPPAR